MNKLFKIIFGIVFAFLFSFMGVGYAQLTDDMTIKGSIIINEQEGIFITSVSVVNENDASTYSNISYSGSTLTSSIILDSEDENSYIMFEITVKNNTNEIVGYNAMTYPSGVEGEINPFYTNENIIFLRDLDNDEKYDSQYELKRKDYQIGIGESNVFRVKVQYKDNVDFSQNELYSAIYFEFLPLDQIVVEDENQGAVSKAIERFSEILNSDDYNELVNTMSGAGSTAGARDRSFIGNTSGAHAEDLTALNDLFSNSLSINIDGQDVPVTILIKRENLDDNDNTGMDYVHSDGFLGIFGREQRNGCEMTLYVTANPLDENEIGKEAVVYAIVYTRDNENSDWYQIGEVFTGKAPVCNYQNGNTGGNSDYGSFNTESWESTEVYNNVPSGNSLSEIIQSYKE